jgi:hypothetical protein
MNRKAHCPACSAQARGIKSRIALHHTCGLEPGEINPDLEMEYRGANSHCKACEDEAAGIKHLQAQKHTCTKKK